MALGLTPKEIVEQGGRPLLAKKDTWKRVEVAKIASVLNGAAFKSNLFNRNGDGMPVIRIRDVGKENTETFYSGEWDEKHVVRKGDLLVGMDGDFRCSFWTGPDALLNQRVCKLIVDETKFDKHLFAYLLQPYLDAIHAETSSVTVKHLSSRSIQQIPIPFPPLPEQKRIVAKIEALFAQLDEGVEKLKAAQEQLKTYRQSVLNEVISKADANTFVPIVEIVEKLDQGWSPKCEKQAAEENEWGVIKTSAIQAGAFIEIENKRLPQTLEQREHLEIRSGDILITRAGPRNRVGVCCLVRNPRSKLILCDKVYRMRVKHNLANDEYIELVLNSPQLANEINELKTGISDSGVNLTQGGFKKLQIPVPSLNEQTQIVQEIESRLSLTDKMEESIEQALKQSETLRQSILKKAFEGSLVGNEGEPVKELG